jgi:hypothetical protein
MTLFAAQEGTFLIERDPAKPANVTRIPIIGWQHIQGNVAFPVCVINHGGLTHNKAILHPEGFVTDPVHGLVCGSIDEWMNFMKTAKSTDKVLNPPSPHTSPVDDPTEAAERARQARLMPDETPRNKPGPAPKPKAAPSAGIAFGTKSFKTRSFWQCEAGVFTVDGGEVYPKDPKCIKVTRNEYDAVRRDGAKVIDPHASPDLGDDEDDGMDMI